MAFERLDKIFNGDEFAQYVIERSIDYIDFGSSGGGSLKIGKRLFQGKRGLGIDISPRKVRVARAKGYESLVFDILKIPDEKLVSFTILSHFCEHINDLSSVEMFVRKAVVISKDFVFIRQPNFDYDGYLFSKGLKFFYSDWRYHPNRMTSLEMYLILSKLQSEGVISRFSIHGRIPVTSVNDPFLHLASEKSNQHHFDMSIHKAKPPNCQFEIPIFRELVAFITDTHIDHTSILERYKPDFTYCDEQCVASLTSV